MKVEEALSEESRERTSVASLSEQLLALRTQVAEALVKLKETQGRVEQNLQQVDNLKSEAVRRSQ